MKYYMTGPANGDESDELSGPIKQDEDVLEDDVDDADVDDPNGDEEFIVDDTTKE